MKSNKLSLFTLLVGLVLLSGASFGQNLNVPYVAPGAITIDGLLNEAQWATAGTIIFGPTTVGYDNALAYGAGGSATDDDQPIQTYKFLHDGNGSVYVGMESNDRSIQTDTSSPPVWWNISQSDGLGFFGVFMKGGVAGDQAYYPWITLTFWPDAGASTVVTPGMGEFMGIPAGTVVAGTGGWDWSLLPGSNTINSPTDADTGYVIEFVFDITHWSYLATDTDITVGIQSTDHDGLPLSDQWPWNNSWCWLYQWSIGGYVQDYTLNHLLLQPSTGVENWSQY